MSDEIAKKTYDVNASEFHGEIDAHHQASRLSQVILGGQDGLVNVLGVTLGVAAATSDPRIVLAAGMAATFAESVSMGAVAYTSTQADRALYESELARERRHIRLIPALERDEIRRIYKEKGFDGAVLDQIVETITSNKDVWVAVMMAEELKLAPVSQNDALRAAIIVGAAAIVGSFIPLMPFIVLPILPAVITSIAVAGATLFAREDYVEEAWRIVNPILKEPTPLYEYEPGTWGPKELNEHIVPPGGWRDPGDVGSTA